MGESGEHRVHLNVQPDKKKKKEFINEKRGGGRGWAEGIHFSSVWLLF